MTTCIFEHFALHLHFTTVIRNALRREPKRLNLRPTLMLIFIFILLFIYLKYILYRLSIKFALCQGYV